MLRGLNLPVRQRVRSDWPYRGRLCLVTAGAAAVWGTLPILATALVVLLNILLGVALIALALTLAALLLGALFGS